MGSDHRHPLCFDIASNIRKVSSPLLPSSMKKMMALLDSGVNVSVDEIQLGDTHVHQKDTNGKLKIG